MAAGVASLFKPAVVLLTCDCRWTKTHLVLINDNYRMFPFQEFKRLTPVALIPLSALRYGSASMIKQRVLRQRPRGRCQLNA